jgi:hypothetical protein
MNISELVDSDGSKQFLKDLKGQVKTPSLNPRWSASASVLDEFGLVSAVRTYAYSDKD